MHYSKKLKMEIEVLQKRNRIMGEAIFDAQTLVLGRPPGVSPFLRLVGNEESIPVTDSGALRKIILKLPFS